MKIRIVGQSPDARPVLAVKAIREHQQGSLGAAKAAFDARELDGTEALAVQLTALGFAVERGGETLTADPQHPEWDGRRATVLAYDPPYVTLDAPVEVGEALGTVFHGVPTEADVVEVDGERARVVHRRVDDEQPDATPYLFSAGARVTVFRD